MRRQRLVSWVSMGLVAAAVAGCSQGPEEEGPEYRIGFCMTLDDPYWQNMRLGAIDEGKKLGAEVTITNAQEDPVLAIF